MGLLTEKILPALKYVVTEFGPLLGFWVLNYTVSTKAAVAGTVLIILIDGLWRISRKLPITKLYIVTSGLTLVFGSIDLFSESPFMLAYEAVVTNLLTGGFFVVGALGKRPLVQELAEQRAGETFADRPDYTLFFRAFTLFWAAYFLLKSVVYFWMAWNLPLVQAMAIRTVAGTASMGVMVLISAFLGPRLFDFGKKRGWLPAVPEDADEVQA